MSGMQKKNHVPTFSYKFEICEFHVYVAAKKKEGLKVASSNDQWWEIWETLAHWDRGGC